MSYILVKTVSKTFLGFYREEPFLLSIIQPSFILLCSSAPQSFLSTRPCCIPRSGFPTNFSTNRSNSTQFQARSSSRGILQIRHPDGQFIVVLSQIVLILLWYGQRLDVVIGERLAQCATGQVGQREYERTIQRVP